MDKQHIKGAADKVKGAVKDAAGKLTGNRKLQMEGKLDKAKGAAREALGNAKDAARAVERRTAERRTAQRRKEKRQSHQSSDRETAA